MNTTKDTRSKSTKKKFPFKGKIPKITVSDKNNWDIGKYHVQTYPKALLITGLLNETILQAYMESLNAYTLLNQGRITLTATGEFKYDRESSSNLYSRNKERLFLLAFETLLKSFVADGFDVLTALEHIRLGRERPKKEFPWQKKEPNAT